MDPTAIIAIAISFLSIVFILITQGPDQITKFRESADTVNRREKINSCLQKELIEELQENKENGIFDLEPDGIENREKIDDLEYFGFTIFVVNNISEDILNKIMQNAKNALKRFIYFSFVVTLTLVIYISTDVTSIFNNFMLAVYAGFALVLGYMMYDSTRKYSNLKEDFIKLYEDPTIENAREIYYKI
ncbi:MAG: hypothetical protein ABSA11_09425 [Candidatus Bathyarchaeia archaeon]|jgi:hypothetical protein